jgi:hypothetical protein
VVYSLEVNIKEYPFSSASEHAYGHIFVSTVLMEPVFSKSRIASLKQLSLPMLELYGALLLTKLVKKPAAVLNHYVNKIYLWTDSNIILVCGMPLHPQDENFVLSSVSEVQDKASMSSWHHISSHCNLADIL